MYFGDTGSSVKEVCEVIKSGMVVVSIAGTESSDALIAKKKGGSSSV